MHSVTWQYGEEILKENRMLGQKCSLRLCDALRILQCFLVGVGVGVRDIVVFI